MEFPRDDQDTALAATIPDKISDLMTEAEDAGFSEALLEAMTLGWHLREAKDQGRTVGDAVTAFCLSGDAADVFRAAGLCPSTSEGTVDPAEVMPPADMKTALTFINSWPS